MIDDLSHPRTPHGWNVVRIPGTPVRGSSTFEIRTNSGKSSRPSCGRRDTCRATASRIGDRWYALGGWLQRSEINLQFKSVGVRARGSSDCRAASAVMILLNLDRFDNGERRDIRARSRVVRLHFEARFVYPRFEVSDPRALHRRRYSRGHAALKWESLDRYRRFYQSAMYIPPSILVYIASAPHARFELFLFCRKGDLTAMKISIRVKIDRFFYFKIDETKFSIL